LAPDLCSGKLASFQRLIFGAKFDKYTTEIRKPLLARNSARNSVSFGPVIQLLDFLAR